MFLKWNSQSRVDAAVPGPARAGWMPQSRPLPDNVHPGWLETVGICLCQFRSLERSSARRASPWGRLGFLGVCCITPPWPSSFMSAFPCLKALLSLESPDLLCLCCNLITPLRTLFPKEVMAVTCSVLQESFRDLDNLYSRKCKFRKDCVWTSARQNQLPPLQTR